MHKFDALEGEIGPDKEPDPYSVMRETAKNLAARDRNAKDKLVKARRAGGLTQSDVDTALGMPEGWTRRIEAYDSDPRLSELRLYENYVMFVKGRGGKRMLDKSEEKG